MAYPVEVEYDLDAVPRGLFDGAPRHGLERWAPVMPPLRAPGLGEGNTPLVELEPGVLVKDESRNPTWSHKDRLNRCTVSAAVGVGAPGIVVASSGNHGASAAAYAARAGLRAVVLLNADAGERAEAWLREYGATVFRVAKERRWPLMRRVVEEFGFHPVSNLTVTHTGHAFGPEGYKSVAYELAAEVGAPAAVFVPTGYGELLFGIGKGFEELRRLGVVDRVPPLYSCEPATGGPLAAAMARGEPAAIIEQSGWTVARAIDCSVSGYRGVHALTRSGGRALLLTDDELARAREEQARAGLWPEASSAIALAGLRKITGGGAVADRFDGPVVCVSTSTGFKDVEPCATRAPVDPDWDTVRRTLA